MSMLVNLTPFPATTFSMLDSDARQFDVVVASATFEARSGQPVRIAEEQSPIREVDEFRGEPGRSSVRHEGQIAPEKARVDVLVEREGSRSRVGGANERPCESTRYLLYEIALALEPPTVVGVWAFHRSRSTRRTLRRRSGCVLQVSGVGREEESEHFHY